jgi:hypothetical protein
MEPGYGRSGGWGGLAEGGSWRVRADRIPHRRRTRLVLYLGCPGQAHFPRGKESALQAYEQLKALVAQIDEDLKKAQGGNKAAGVRVRQTCQEIKAASQEIREQILTLRGPGEAPPKA